ncbi:MAG: FHA domain-containing protein [Anaerolineae bacterium]|nr:FHA domain-containing protein [Anaerolineae bacterium]
MMYCNRIGLWLRIIVCLSCLWIAFDEAAAASTIHHAAVDDRDMPFVAMALTSSGVFSTTGVISETMLVPSTTLTLTVQFSGITVINSQFPTYTTVIKPEFTSWVVPVSIPENVSGTLPFTLTMHVGAFETAIQQIAVSIAAMPTLSKPTLSPTPSPTPTALPTPPSATIDNNSMAQPPENVRHARELWPQALPWPGLWIGGIAVLAVITVILLARALRRRQLKSAHRAAVALPPPSLVSDGVPPQPVLEKTEIQAAYLMFPGDMSQRFILAPEGTTIGRAADNVLAVDATFPAWETVSTYHARIFYLDNAWRLEDLDSHNGVYVNGQRTGRNLLRDGWEISIGDLKFIFHTEGAKP